MNFRAVLPPLGSSVGAGIALLLLAACGETGPSEQAPPATVTNVTGTSLTGVAGQALGDRVTVQVLDGTQNVLEGITVTFAVTGGGGSVDPASVVTDRAGEARTRWTLGRTAGVNTLRVTAEGGVSTTVSAVGTAGRVGDITLSTGENQTGVVGTALPISPAVVVRDVNGNPIDGATVLFSVSSGGGRVAQPAARTNAQGIASAGAWTLGSTAGRQTLAAQVTEAGVTGNPVVFQATASAGPPAIVTAVSPTTQSAQAGGLVASPPSVLVQDALGNPVPNVSVTFAVSSGGGQVGGGTQVTTAQGIATATSWRLGGSTGTNTVIAVVTGLPDVTFTAGALAGAPVGLVIAAGDGQSIAIGRAVPVAPEVKVVDVAGNGVSGVVVNFIVGLGGGSVVLGRQVTGADGIAAVGAWFMGPTPGTNTLIASSTGLSPVTITATAMAGPPVSMVALSTVSQTGVAGQPAASVPSVVVRDAQGNPVSDVPVTFSVTAGGGNVTGASQLTGANGIATAGSWTLGATSGVNTVEATSPGLPTVVFSATTVGTPAAVSVYQGAAQAAVQGTAVPINPAIRVVDNSGAPVPGVVATFSVVAGGGSVAGGSTLTDANGVATSGSWVLGNGAANTLSAAVGASGVTGNPVTFTALAATKIVVTSQPPPSASSGANFGVIVQLQTAGNLLAPVSGLPLTISIASGAGTLNSGSTALTVQTTNGVAAFNVNITGATGPRTLSIAGSGVVSALTTTINVP